MVDVDVDVNVLRERLSPLGATEVAKLTGGASSLTYAATTADGPVVVKVAPAGLEPVRNRDVLRQARLLRALAGTDVPVPEVVWEDPGQPPEIPPLFVMTRVEGTSHEPLFDHEEGDEPGVVAERMHAAALVLASLHALPPPGDEVVTLDDEIGRWTRLLETVDPALAPGWPEIAARLREAQPSAAEPAIVHGDYRLGNLLAVGPVITAVIDWEIWSVGDPRVDLGWFLVNADPDTYGRGTRYAGLLPTPAELASTYGDVRELRWFEALACFKSAATWSLIVKHNRRRPAPDPLPEQVADRLPALLDRASVLLSA